MTDKKDEIQAHMIAAIEKSHSIEQMQIRLESLTDTEANLTGFGKDRKLPNPLPNYNIAQDIKDLKNACLKLLPNAMVKAIELQDPTIFQRALEDAMLIALATKKPGKNMTGSLMQFVPQKKLSVNTEQNRNRN